MYVKITLLFVIVCSSFFQYIDAIGPIECTRPNEEYHCGSACQTTCRNLGEVCPIVNIRCNDKCYCIEGYARDDSRTCIPISECPPKTATPIECTRPNEERRCGSACQTTCRNFDQVCPIVNKRCNDTCYCIKDYARDDSGTCIPISQCPPKSSYR